jgi:microspherule protein 1
MLSIPASNKLHFPLKSLSKTCHMGLFQTNDLRTVHRGTKLSCRFTVQELQQRWYALLYDPAVSRVAVAAMRNLHPELIASVQSRALYSKAEEQLLGTVKSVSVLFKA